MSDNIKNPHSGHRKRLKSRFLSEDLDGFEPHNALELMLFYSIPLRDTNETAHNLLRKFGNIEAVFSADYSELLTVEGINEHSATLIKLIPSMQRIIQKDKTKNIKTIRNSTEIGDVMMPIFEGLTEEAMGLICLDSKGKILFKGIILKGSVNAVQVSVRKIIEQAIRCNSTAIVIAHNHPGGLAVPSREDFETTEHLMKMLHNVSIELVDHIVIADGDFVSMADSNVIVTRGGERKVLF